MKNRTNLLFALFVFQLILAGGLFFGKAASNTDSTRQALIDAQKGEIDHITIENGQGEQVILQKTEDLWNVTNYHGLPANPAKVDTLLDRLFDIRGGWPVATTAVAQKRFEVAEEKFQRRIILAQGEEVRSELYVGTSPGFKKVHLRRAKDSEVFSVVFNIFDTPAQVSAWFDRSLIQEKGELAAIQGPDFHLTRVKGEWAAVKPGGEVLTEAANKLLEALKGLQVEGAETEETPEVQRENAKTFLVTAGGKTTSYTFFENNGRYFVRHPDFKVNFTVSKPEYAQITDQGAKTLVKTQNGEPQKEKPQKEKPNEREPEDS